MLELRIPATDEAGLFGVQEDRVRIKGLDEFNVARSCLWAGIGNVLIQGLPNRHALDLAEAGNHATGPMATLIAVDPERVVRAVHDEEQSLADRVDGGRAGGFALFCFFIGRDRNLSLLDLELVQPLGIAGRWISLDQGTKKSQR